MSRISFIKKKLTMNRACDLLGKLNCLTLTGQNEEGELEWIGTSNQWRSSEIESEYLLREFNNDF